MGCVFFINTSYLISLLNCDNPSIHNWVHCRRPNNTRLEMEWWIQERYNLECQYCLPNFQISRVDISPHVCLSLRGQVFNIWDSFSSGFFFCILIYSQHKPKVLLSTDWFVYDCFDIIQVEEIVLSHLHRISS